MNQLSEKSMKIVETLHHDLKLILIESAKVCAVKFELYEGGRNVTTQQKYFDTGRSKINPKKYATVQDLAKVAKHITIENDKLYELSRAVDLLVNEKHNGNALTWDKIHFSYIAGVIKTVAQSLYNRGLTNHLIRWGGDWNNNGIINLDQSLDDMPHFELIKP